MTTFFPYPIEVSLIQGIPKYGLGREFFDRYGKIVLHPIGEVG